MVVMVVTNIMRVVVVTVVVVTMVVMVIMVVMVVTAGFNEMVVTAVIVYPPGFIDTNIKNGCSQRPNDC